MTVRYSAEEKVFTPRLAPQIQLRSLRLFGRALAGLAQPLPAAERMPDKIFRPIM